MKLASLSVLTPLLVSSLVACTDEGVEDAADDVFMTDDAKTDGFGVEDWSPDGAAVLKVASQMSASKLENEVGLSAKVSSSIVAHRAELAGHTYKDLADLDAAPYVGRTVFGQLLKYATDHHLYQTAIRIPLGFEDGTTKKLLASFNDKARTAGVTPFARYTFVNVDTDFGAKMANYEARMKELGTKTGLDLEIEMPRYASSVDEYAVGSLKPCFVGTATDVPDITSGQADNMMGDMYSLWGWRYGTKKWIYDDQPESDMNFDSTWGSWNKSSKAILLEATNTDDGGDPRADVIAPCR
jgi:hypothetical protein